MPCKVHICQLSNYHVIHNCHDLGIYKVPKTAFTFSNTMLTDIIYYCFRHQGTGIEEKF